MGDIYKYSMMYIDRQKLKVEIRTESTQKPNLDYESFA